MRASAVRRRHRGRRLMLVAVCAFAVIGGGADPVGAASVPPGPAPLGIKSASLGQQGRDLLWRVRLDGPYSPTALRQAGGSLCLLAGIGRRSEASLQACVIGPAAGRRMPRIVVQRLAPGGTPRGRARVVSAVVSRGSSREFAARFSPVALGAGFGDALGWQVASSVCSAGDPLTDCRRLRPARPALLHLHPPVPIGCVPSGPSYVTNGSRARRVVALTFDDGPWPDTPGFLAVLEREHVPATFFQIGEQISTYGRGVESRILADGDLLGDHTWSHANVSGAGAFAQAELTRAHAAIEGATGFSTCLFRAPYGAVSWPLIQMARGMAMLTIEWDVDPTDWARPGTPAIVARVLSQVRPGSIILQHDGGGNRSQTLAALPREIDALKARGYGFVTLADLLGVRVIYR